MVKLACICNKPASVNNTGVKFAATFILLFFLTPITVVMNDTNPKRPIRADPAIKACATIIDGSPVPTRMI